MNKSVSKSTLSKRARLKRCMYTMAETAALLGISYTTLNELVKTGKPPVHPVKIGRQYLFPMALVHKELGLEPPVITDAGRD